MKAESFHHRMQQVGCMLRACWLSPGYSSSILAKLALFYVVNMEQYYSKTKSPLQCQF
jgi:hypothetical protein